MNVPARCRAVYACLAGHAEQPRYVRQTGKWRNIDIIQATGRNSSDVRLRELLRLNPQDVLSEAVPGSKCGAKRFWLATRPWCPAIKPARTDRGLETIPSLFAIDQLQD